MNCPHCQHALTPHEVAIIASPQIGALLAALKTKPSGGRPRSTGPRCPCGLLTVKMAAIRHHHCERKPLEIPYP